ncbi:hypothetical protein AAP_05779 [Ascosphaera apis ARSEF 7405]|uniref:Uncharacterized protein n=1 Tax=Ascosphaera apis ARSEF 7405 TaxID=392613 RepID=A0A167VA75_9EURO|nr:hypothetical protein AAP_05779 [Ascosphaera apis ARSEF 7405]
MGCDLLALNLVKQWKFLTPPPLPPSHQLKKKLSEEFDLRNDVRQHMLRRRSSLTVADIPPILTNKENDETKKPASKKAPTMFTEPDANSLLDSFGF